jgi:protease I
MKSKRLKGVRVALLAADGFEQVEVTFPKRALERAGADVRIISLRPGRIRGVNLMWPGRKLPVDDVVFNARPEDYGALYLPGGFVNPDLLRQSERVRDFVQRFEASGRPIATMCHGPEVLISSGLAKGRVLAAWPGIADDLRNAGATWENQPVVHDGNWVSARDPRDLPKFIPAMIDHFAERATRAVSRLPRRVRWTAAVSRIGTAAALAGLVFGARALLRYMRVV